MKFITTLLLFSLFQNVCLSQVIVPTTTEFTKEQTVKEITYPFKLGKTKVNVIMTFYGNNKDIVMINLHDNESTSVEAAKLILKETGGTLLRIENNNQRLIDFTLKRVNYQFDPNRMFTVQGTTATLKRYSQANAEAVQLVWKFGAFVLSKIPESSLLIALHNNTEGTYSTLSYLPDGEEAAEAALVNYNPEWDADDFFFTTSTSLFEALKNSGFNVILQNNVTATDDGSLSVLYGKRGKNYVNVEAEQGHVMEQEKMIRQLVNILAQKQAP